MKPQIFSRLAIVALAMVFVSSCTRGDDNNTAGKGGNAELRITTRHHTQVIDTCMVYLKYNATQAPTTPYDDSAWVVINSTDTAAVFSGLKKGNYFIYGSGYDVSIAEEVKGGIPFQITDDIVYRINAPVSEVH